MVKRPFGNSVNGPFCPSVGRPVGSRIPLRSILLDQRDAGRFARRRTVNARLRCFLRNNLIDFAAHDLVAFARRFFEPRPVNLDEAPLIRSDGTRRPELAHNQRHCCSSYPKQLRKRLLRQWYDVAINSIVNVKQPAGHAGLDGVQCIAGGQVLKLRQQRQSMGLDRVSDGATLAKGCTKS